MSDTRVVGWSGIAAALVAVLTGCGSSASSPDAGDTDVDGATTVDAGNACLIADPPDPATVPLRGPCPLADKLGGFELVENGNYTAISGDVSDGVVPLSILEEVAAEGDCKLLRRANPFCTPACDGTETCDFDGNCIPFPRRQDLGLVRVEGLAVCSEMAAHMPGNLYYDTALPNPAFAAGDPIRLISPAGDYGPLELNGLGVTPLDAKEPSVTVTPGQPLAIAWNAVPADTRSRILVSLNIDQHGLTPVTLVCDFADTGTAEISASLIDQLFGGGVSGFPNARIVRHTSDSQEVGGGCVDLTVASEREVNVTTR